MTPDRWFVALAIVPMFAWSRRKDMETLEPDCKSSNLRPCRDCRQDHLVDAAAIHQSLTKKHSSRRRRALHPGRRLLNRPFQDRDMPYSRDILRKS